MNQQAQSDDESKSRDLNVNSRQQELNVLTVTQVTSRIKTLLEKRIGNLWVKGEISNLSRPRSGHVYFSLKDEESVLPVVLFRHRAEKVDFDLEDGLEVRVNGTVSAYPPHGEYQIQAKKVKPLGEGALQLALKQLKEKLKKEGLFRDDEKQPLPQLPERIAVVTSPTGAAVRDIIRTIHQRYAHVSILVVPVSVQGDGAKDEIAEAIRLVNRRDLADVIITGRGGGSLEDLWAFNEEVVARAIFDSQMPVVSAVGHEVDTSISDLVADRVAPTPTAAGQVVVPELRELSQKLQDRFDRATRICRRILRKHRSHLEDTSKAVLRAHPGRRLREKKKQLYRTAEAIDHEMDRILDRCEDGLSARAEQLDSLSPLNVLSRGYSITWHDERDEILKRAEDTEEGDVIRTRLSEGTLRTEVLSKRDEAPDHPGADDDEEDAPSS